MLRALEYFLHRVSTSRYAERCTSYSKSVRLTDCHTLELCQNDSIRSCGLHHDSSNVSWAGSQNSRLKPP